MADTGDAASVPYTGPERRSNEEFNRLTEEVSRLSKSNTQLGNALTSLGTIQQRQMEQEEKTRKLEREKVDTTYIQHRVKVTNVVYALFAVILAIGGYVVWTNHNTIVSQRNQRIASLTTGETNCINANDALDKQRQYYETLEKTYTNPAVITATEKYLATFPKDQDCSTSLEQLKKLGHPYQSPPPAASHG